MPIFEYCCVRCDERFEELVRGAEDVHCPHCGAADARKLLSAFAVSAEATGGRADASPAFGPGACGTCGDPRGPGSCSS